MAVNVPTLAMIFAAAATYLGLFLAERTIVRLRRWWKDRGSYRTYRCLYFARPGMRHRWVVGNCPGAGVPDHPRFPVVPPPTMSHSWPREV
jgi:hypothetical protein